MERSLESLILVNKNHMANRAIFSLMLQNIVSSMVLTQSYGYPCYKGHS